MEIVSFKNKASIDVALNVRSKEARNVLPTKLFMAAIKKLRFIEASSSIEDLSNYKSFNLEKLKGNAQIHIT